MGARQAYLLTEVLREVAESAGFPCPDGIFLAKGTGGYNPAFAGFFAVTNLQNSNPWQEPVVGWHPEKCYLRENNLTDGLR